MRNPTELYSSTGAHGRQVDVLVHTLSGSLDAGHAGRLVAEHLLNTLPSEPVVTFDVDQLIDYRSRRPSMHYESGTWADYDEPKLAIDLLRDDEGVPLLLLHGVEPDLHWESFVTAVRQVIDDFGITTSIGAHGIPMGVPHTRPVTVTAHATRSDLIADHPNFVGSVQVPGYPAALLEFRLGQEGRDALGFAANVPHYLAQTQFPQAAAELIRQVARSGGLSLPVGDLEADGVRVLAEIDRQVADSDEVAAVVRALEAQFDGFAADAQKAGQMPLTGGTEPLPSADELGAQIEAFLAGTGEQDPTGDEGQRG
ncbi:MAG: PAC2 family protein [Beutenbergiaceae bacterium]